MVTMFIKSKLSDYDNWKRFYDDFAPTRKEKGVTGAGVYRHANDPDMVTVTHQFKNIQAATEFANLEVLKLAMMKSGVVGPPDIWFTEDVEQTAYLNSATCNRMKPPQTRSLRI
jgi:quinol monooxygenase YgiN